MRARHIGPDPCGSASTGPALFSVSAGTDESRRASVSAARHCRVAVGSAAAWVTRDQAAELVRVSLGPDACSACTFGPQPFDVLLAAGFAWVTSWEDGTVSKIDPREGGRRSKCDRSRGPYATGLAWCGRRVGSVTAEARHASRLSTRRHSGLSQVDAWGDPGVAALASGVRCRATPDTVIRLDARTGRGSCRGSASTRDARRRSAGAPTGSPGPPTRSTRSSGASLLTGRGVDSVVKPTGAFAVARLGDAMRVTSFAGSDARTVRPAASRPSSENAPVATIEHAASSTRRSRRSGTEPPDGRLSLVPRDPALRLGGGFAESPQPCRLRELARRADPGRGARQPARLRGVIHPLLDAGQRLRVPRSDLTRGFAASPTIRSTSRSTRRFARVAGAALPARARAAGDHHRVGARLRPDVGPAERELLVGVERPQGGALVERLVVRSAAAAAAAVVAWFFIVWLGRAPRGLRDLTAYALGYGAQAGAYLVPADAALPDVGPGARRAVLGPPEHPVRAVVDDDLIRPRLTVLFRLFLAIPATSCGSSLWSIARSSSAPSSAGSRRSFWGAFPIRCTASLRRTSGMRPISSRSSTSSVAVPGLHRARRLVWSRLRDRLRRPSSGALTILFRFFLAVPAFIVASALGGVAFVLALLVWWYALVTARMPEG